MYDLFYEDSEASSVSSSYDSWSENDFDGYPQPLTQRQLTIYSDTETVFTHMPSDQTTYQSYWCTPRSIPESFDWENEDPDSLSRHQIDRLEEDHCYDQSGYDPLICDLHYGDNRVSLLRALGQILQTLPQFVFGHSFTTFLIYIFTGRCIYFAIYNRGYPALICTACYNVFYQWFFAGLIWYLMTLFTFFRQYWVCSHLSDQSGVEHDLSELDLSPGPHVLPTRRGEVEIHLTVPTTHWDPRYDRLVYYNFNSTLGRFIANRYETELGVVVTVASGRPHVIIKITLDEDISQDPGVDLLVHHFNNSLSGIYNTCFLIPTTDIFWDWQIYTDQSGRESKKEKRKEHNRRMTKKEKKDAISSLVELPDYMELRRSSLNMERLVVAPEALEGMTEISVKKKFIKMCKLVTEAAAHRNRIDLRLNLPVTNQSGVYDQARVPFFSIDDLFGCNNAFTQTMTTLIRLHRPDLTVGEGAKVILQFSMWSYELVTAESVSCFLRKVILLSTHVFPDVCSKILDDLIVGTFSYEEDQFGFDTFTGLFKELNRLWHSKDEHLVGVMKKVALLMAAGSVMASKLESCSPVDIMKLLIEPSQEEIDKVKPADFITFFLEAAKFFTQAAADAWYYGDFMGFFRIKDTVSFVTEEYIDIMDKYNRYHTFGTLLKDFDFEELKERCIKLKQQLKSCNGHPKLGGMIRYTTMVHNINKIIAACDHKFGQSPLNAKPFAFMLYSPPETGKSSVATKIMQSIGVKHNWSCGPADVCVMNLSDKYQSTADNQRFVMIDDINQGLPMRTQENASLMLLKLINPVPFPVNKAELEQKGNSFLCPKVVAVTAQTQHGYFHDDVHEPAAIARRFDAVIKVEVKKKYATEGGAIDKTKLDGNRYIHEFTVTEPHSVGLTVDGKQIIRQRYIVRDFGDGNGPIALHKITHRQLLFAMVSMFDEHMTSEESHLEGMRDVSACPHGMLQDACFECGEDQSDVHVHLVKQRALVGAYMDEVLTQQEKLTEQEEKDRLAAEMNDATIDHAGLDLAWLYKLATLVSACFMWFSTTRRIPGRWRDPRNWYANFIASSLVDEKLGWKGKVFLPSTTFALGIIFPFYYCGCLTILWAAPLMMTSFCLSPFIAYDTFCNKISGWSIRQLISFESEQRCRQWASNPVNRVCAAMTLIVTSVVGLIAYNIHKSVPAEDITIDNGGDFSMLTSKYATKKPEEWTKDVFVTPYVKNTGNFVREQIIGFKDSPGMLSTSLAYCVSSSKQSTNALPYRGNFWFIPYHFMKANWKERFTFFISGLASNGVKYGWTPGPEDLQWKRIPGSDIAVCSISEMPPQKDISRLFTDDFVLTTTGTLVYKDVNIETKEVRSTVVPLIFSGIGTTNSSSEREITYPCVSYTTVGSVTKPGMCMAPVITDIKHPTIIGLHTKGGGAVGRANLVKRSEIDVVIESMLSKNVVFRPISSDRLRIVGGVSTQVHPKHVGRFVEDTENVTFLGQALGITNRAAKIHTTKTPIYQSVLDQFGIDDIYQPTPNKPKWLAKHNMMKNFSEPTKPDPALVERASEDYKAQWKELFDKKPEVLKGVRKMTLDECMMGVNGVPGFEPLNTHTSIGHMGVLLPGYRNGGPKSDILEVKYTDEDGCQQYSVSCPEKLQRELEELKEQLATGQRLGAVCATNLKDETLKATKLHGRLFSCLPLAFIMLQRIYLLSIAKLFRVYNFTSECAVGVNAHSPLWDTFGKYMKKFHNGTPSNIAGDFKAYDQKAMVLFLVAAYNIVLWICLLAGYDDTDLLIISSLVCDLIYPIYDINGDLVMPSGSNPSGQSLTVIVNSILNSLYMRYVFFSVLPDLIRFQSYVALLTYGDDNIMDVHALAREAFNQMRSQEY